MDKGLRALLKKNHFCLDCRQQDAYTFSGHCYCYDCNEKRNAKAKERRKRDKSAILHDAKARYWKRRAEYRCVGCGRELGFLDLGVYCAWCRAKRSNRWKRQYEPKRVPGMCYQCTKQAPMKGKKLCAECYEKNMAKLEKAWEIRRQTNE